MKIWVDFYCRKCQIEYEDRAVDSNYVEFECPQCGNKCERVYNKMSFKERFKGSHKNEY